MAYDYRKEARKAAKRYGLDPYVFERQINQESGFNPTIRSPKGATGIAQIIPETARAWGVNPLDPIASLNAAAKNMAGYVKKYGGYENALRAYNAGPGAIQASHGFSETNNYVKTILGGRTPGGLASPSAGSGNTSFAAATPSGSGSPAAPTGLADPGTSGDFTGLLGSLLSKPAPVVQQQAVAPPSFAAHAPTPKGFIAATPEAQPQQAQAPGVDSALSLIGSLRGTDPSDQAGMAGDAPETGPETTVTRVQKQRAAGITPLGGAKNAGNGSFTIDGPDPGRLQKGVVSFADQVAGVLGAPLVGKDGSSHSKYTVNGNVSDHYAGNATDIFSIGGKPATGATLLRAGRAALIAAGMPRAQALAAKGGLYNVNGHQIIFLTNEGGNHFDHLHISAR